MSEAPTHLTYEQALPIAAALHARTKASTPLPPFPGCPACGTTPVVLDLSDTRSFITDMIVMTFLRCGHAFEVTREDLYNAYMQARREQP